jgi:hypothetical protein
MKNVWADMSIMAGDNTKWSDQFGKWFWVSHLKIYAYDLIVS